MTDHILDPTPAPAPAPPSGLFEAERSAEIVAASFAGTADERLRQVLGALVRHTHAFVKEVGLTTEEWAAGVRFLTETGRTCDDTRQEFIMLSDVLGVSMLVETLNNPADGRFTESTVEGPFHLVDSPPRALGDSIDEAGQGGEPCLVTGRVMDADGHPVAGARVDVWQADADGFYDVQRPGEVPDRNLRGLFTADDDGRFRFRTIVPNCYPIPTDGPVGRLLRATGRHANRAAHLHIEVSAPGIRTLTTHLFVDGSRYLDSDAVFGVKESLIRAFTRVDDPARAAEHGLPNPFRHVDFPVTVRRDTEP
ncbi:dioxygenase [Streptomyces sp. NPDC051133]|uniref:dioxygenase family protein n=1 Tax=Streptomyces sp. NPDC051133 TaxID=3155521 RepID=UPI003421CF44